MNLRAVALGCLLSVISAATLGAVAPDAGLPSLDPVKWAGPPVSFESLRGKTVVLLVYATWCPKCNKWSGEFFAQLKEAVKDKPVVVLAINELDGERLYNTAVLVGPDGSLGRYRKLHLFKDEKDIFQPGNLGLPAFDCGPAKIGMLVCFDWIFPEAWRVLMLNGAEIICHPANLVLPDLAQRAVPVHAMVSRVFVVTANRVGREGPLTFTGQSLIANPLGQVLAVGPQEGPHTAVVEIDPRQARDKMITPRNRLIADRRPAEYSALVDIPRE